MTTKPKPTTAESMQAAVRLLGLASWLMVALAIAQAFFGDLDQVNNALLLAILMRILRQEIWQAGLLYVTTQGLRDGIARGFAKVKKTPPPDPFSEPYGDMPGLPGADKDSNTEKKGE
jgi:hypothetical protein